MPTTYASQGAETRGAVYAAARARRDAELEETRRLQQQMRMRVSCAGAVVDADIGEDAAGEHRGVLAQQAAQARAAQQATLQRQASAHVETAEPHPRPNPSLSAPPTATEPRVLAPSTPTLNSSGLHPSLQ